MKVMINILRVLLTVLLCAALLINLWMLAQQVLLHRDAPEVFGYSQYIVTSGSMEPEFSAGDLILVKQQASYELGDVVTFRTGDGAVVTHRIVGRVEGQFITRGDANNADDGELLPPENILGKLQVVLPGVGQVVLFFRTPLGLLLLLALGLFIIKLPDWADSLKTKARGKHAHEIQS